MEVFTAHSYYPGLKGAATTETSSSLYNGLGQRVQQTVGAIVTQYVLDLQPGLWQVLSAFDGTNTSRYVHGPLGLLNQQAGLTWTWPLSDGLGSVREVVDLSSNPLESRLYSPYGESYNPTGTQQTVFGFTGETTDGNGLVPESETLPSSSRSLPVP